jgi:uncharacterized protein
MEKVFLDANVLFSAAYQRSSGLLKLWDFKNVRLITSFYAFEEALRNLDLEEQHQRLKKIMMRVKIVAEAHNPKNIIPPLITLHPKDQPILAAALQAKANYLITGDIQHFGKYFSKDIHGMIICPPASYIKKRRSQKTH